VVDMWLYLVVPSIDDHHLGSNVSHPGQIKRTCNNLMWTSHSWDKNRSSHYASRNLGMHKDHTIETNHLWCDSSSVDFNGHHLFYINHNCCGQEWRFGIF
jgi:hypothetical protein